MGQLPTHAIPSLLASILNLTLALVAGATGRSRLERAFAGFCFGFSLLAFATFLLAVARNGDAFLFGFRIMALVLPVTMVASVYYILVLTGYATQLDRRVYGVSVRVYVCFAVPFSFVTAAAFWVPDLVIVGVKPVPETGRYDLISSSWLYPLLVIEALAMFWLFAAMVTAYGEATEPARRRFLRHNLVGVMVVYITGIVGGVLLPKLGYNQGSLASDIALFVGAIIFYVALLRYQLDRYEQLNQKLEQKVQQRTRHLEEAQTQLVQAEKMAALGNLVAGIVHEVNSPVGALNAASHTVGKAAAKLEQMIAGNGRSDDRRVKRVLQALQDGAEVSCNASERVSSVVDKLKHFASLDAEVTSFDLHAGIEATLSFLALEMKDVQIEREYDQQLPELVCHPAELNQVFMHLLRNALQAMSGQGKLKLRTKVMASALRISFTDNGRGIEPARLAKLFSFDFSKAGGRVKLGMGLAISDRIVRQHGGSIEVWSEPGKGSTFTVVLPLAS